MRNILWVVIWAVAFAFVEASVVEYLRSIYYPLADGGFRFPILTLADLDNMGQEHIIRLRIEIGREFCTLIMLATLGLIAGRNRREAWAYFMIAFGVWDIFYYVWLKVFIDWPPDLISWDLLFLIPVPWVGPVVTPVIISICLIVSGLIVLWFEDKRRPLVLTWRDWIMIVIGGIVVIASFCWDYRDIMAGNHPQAFALGIFLLGLALSAATFAFRVRQRLKQASNRSD